MKWVKQTKYNKIQNY